MNTCHLADSTSFYFADLMTLTWADFQLITLTHFAELLWTELNMNYCILLWNLIRLRRLMHEWIEWWPRISDRFVMKQLYHHDRFVRTFFRFMHASCLIYSSMGARSFTVLPYPCLYFFSLHACLSVLVPSSNHQHWLLLEPSKRGKKIPMYTANLTYLKFTIMRC